MTTMIKKKIISPDFSYLYYMAKQPKGKFSTWKKKKPLERQVADKLVKTHERNEKLKEKNINTSFLDLF